MEQLAQNFNPAKFELKISLLFAHSSMWKNTHNYRIDGKILQNLKNLRCL